MVSPETFRPPPLRTSSTYDDDDAFNSVALNLLSRHRALDLSVAEVIKCTLVKPQDRASFFEGLQHRKCRVVNISPSTYSLLQDTDRTFGSELRRIVESESSILKRQNVLPTPRNNMLSSGSSGSSSSGAAPLSTRGTAPKKRKTRRFFPDCDSSVLFRSRRVQNIDWRLVDAISQVQSLKLDGAPSGTMDGVDSYEPPTMGYQM